MEIIIKNAIERFANTSFCSLPLIPHSCLDSFPCISAQAGTSLLGCHDSSRSPESDTPLVIGSNQSAEDIDHCAEIDTPNCIDGQIE